MSSKVTLEIEQEVYDKLIELATEMNIQDPRCTRMPHMFQIRDWERDYDWNLNGDTKCWIDHDGDFTVIETLDEFKDHLQYLGVEEPENIDELWEDEWELKDWIEDNCDRLEECSYSMRPIYKNCFLTAKAAEEHLKLNYYHYHKDADIYLNHAWRNPEAELVSEFLLSLIGKKMHT
jgi:hypothetical protein